MSIVPEPTSETNDEEPEAPPPASAAFVIDPKERARDWTVGHARSWMGWIAVFSVLNVLLAVNASSTWFPGGLVISSLIAELGVEIGRAAANPGIPPAMGLVASLPAFAFGGLWWFATRERRWIWAIAAVACGLDLLLFAGYLGATHSMHLIGVAVHLWLFWALARGYQVLRST